MPLCENCNTPIRPDVCFFGEMVDNSVITRAAQEVQKADMLLALGTNLNTYLCTQLVNYYEGDKLVVVHSNPHFSDRSEMCIRDSIKEGKIKNAMIIGKGSLFLGRMTNLFDGVSFVIHGNTAAEEEAAAGVSEDEVKGLIAKAMKDFAATLMAE